MVLTNRQTAFERTVNLAILLVIVTTSINKINLSTNLPWQSIVTYSRPVSNTNSYSWHRMTGPRSTPDMLVA